MPADMKQFTFRLPEHLIVELDRIAAASSVSRAGVVRTLLAAALTRSEGARGKETHDNR